MLCVLLEYDYGHLFFHVKKFWGEWNELVAKYDHGSWSLSYVDVLNGK